METKRYRRARRSLLGATSLVGLLAAVHPAQSQGVTLTPGAQAYVTEVSAVSPALGAFVANVFTYNNAQIFVGASPSITVQAGHNGGPQYNFGVNFAQVTGNVVLPKGVVLENEGAGVLLRQH